jgi:hypothetical protein
MLHLNSLEVGIIFAPIITESFQNADLDRPLKKRLSDSDSIEADLPCFPLLTIPDDCKDPVSQPYSPQAYKAIHHLLCPTHHAREMLESRARSP